MTRLIVLRHGLTAWNQQGRIQGHHDEPLCGAGRRQLRGMRLPRGLRTLPCHSSPLLRARQTARLLGLRTVTNEPALREMHWGAWEGERVVELRQRHGEAMRQNEALGLEFLPPGGESPRQLGKRLQPWLTRIGHLTRPCVIVTHKGVIRVLLARATGWDMRGPPPHRLEWNRAHLFNVDRRGKLSILRTNIPVRGLMRFVSA